MRFQTVYKLKIHGSEYTKPLVVEFDRYPTIKEIEKEVESYNDSMEFRKIIYVNVENGFKIIYEENNKIRTGDS